MVENPYQPPLHVGRVGRRDDKPPAPLWRRALAILLILVGSFGLAGSFEMFTDGPFLHGLNERGLIGGVSYALISAALFAVGLLLRRRSRR